MAGIAGVMGGPVEVSTNYSQTKKQDRQIIYWMSIYPLKIWLVITKKIAIGVSRNGYLFLINP